MPGLGQSVVITLLTLDVSARAKKEALEKTTVQDVLRGRFPNSGDHNFDYMRFTGGRKHEGKPCGACPSRAIRVHCSPPCFTRVFLSHQVHLNPHVLPASWLAGANMA